MAILPKKKLEKLRGGGKMNKKIKMNRILAVSFIITFSCFLFYEVFLHFVLSYAQEYRRHALKKVEEGLKYIKTATSRDDLKIALTKFKDASRTDPNLPLPYYMTGITCYELDWYECAIENLNTYLRLETNPPDINEVKQILTDANQKLERLNKIKKMMTKERKWTLVNYTPETFNRDEISTEFKIDENERMIAKHPFYYYLNQLHILKIEKEWSPVEFDGLFFKYEYKCAWEGENVKTGKIYYNYRFHIIKGEIILSNPPKIVQRAYGSAFLLNDIKPNEKDFEVLGEAIYEIR